MGGVLLDEKKQEKGKVPQNDTFPTHIGRQRRPLGALWAFREAKNWCATCLPNVLPGVLPLEIIPPPI